jgi:hypothetical protein
LDLVTFTRVVGCSREGGRSKERLLLFPFTSSRFVCIDVLYS